MLYVLYLYWPKWNKKLIFVWCKPNYSLFVFSILDTFSGKEVAWTDYAFLLTRKNHCIFRISNRCRHILNSYSTSISNFYLDSVQCCTLQILFHRPQKLCLFKKSKLYENKKVSHSHWSLSSMKKRAEENKKWLDTWTFPGDSRYG